MRIVEFALQPPRGAVRLDQSDAQVEFTLRWLETNESRWLEEAIVPSDELTQIGASREGHWAEVVSKDDVAFLIPYTE